MKKIIFFIVSLLILLSSCTRSPENPAAESTLTKLSETSHEITETPKNAGLPSPTIITTPQSVTPSFTPPEPEGLNSKGPYILYGGPVGVWISNPNGEYLTHLFSGEFQNDLRDAVSPDGKHLALVTKDDHGYELILVEIPGGQLIKVAQLLDGYGEDMEDPKTFVEQALQRHNILAWQPKSGRYLAFVAAIDAPTTDLYLFDTRDGQIKQLTDDPSHAIAPTWSPNGQSIVNYRVHWQGPFYEGITDYDLLEGVWVVDYTNGKIVELPDPEDDHPTFIGWHQAQHFLSCEDGLLKSIDIKTGWETEIIHCCCDQLSQSSRNESLLFNMSFDCNLNYQSGIYYLASPFAKPIKVFDQPAQELIWIPESEVWFAYPEALISQNGRKIYQPPINGASYHPAVSTNNSQAWMVIEEEQPVVKVLVPGGVWQTILHGQVNTLVWDPHNPRRLLIVSEDGRLMSAEPPNLIPKEIGTFGGLVDQAIYIP